MGAGLGLAVPLGLATKQFADFEQAMARTRGLLNLEKTDDMFRSLSEEAKRLGRETVFTAGEAAQAMSVFALAGMKANDILKATAPTLNLAAAGQLNMAQAADISMKVMAGMGIETQHLGYAIDVLTKAMTTANTDLVMLGEAFKYVGPVAKSAGLSFEETTAAIQMLSNAGMQADMAGTTLRGAILSLTSPSQEALTMLRQLGVAVNDARGNFRPLVDIIGDLENSLKGMGTGRQLEVIGTIFANRQATGISELVSQGAGKLREMTAELTKAGREKVSSRIASVQLDTLIGSWKLFTSAVEGVAVAIGEALAPTLRAWGDAITAVTNALNRIAIINAEWIPMLAETAGTLVVVGGALWTVGAAVKVLAFGLGWVIAPAIGLVAGAVGLLLSPIGLVVAAIGGITYALLSLTKTGRNVLGELGKGFAAIGGTISKAWAGIADAFMAGDLSLAAKIAFKGIHLAWNQLIVAMGTAWESFTGDLLKNAKIIGIRVKYDTGAMGWGDAGRREYEKQLLEANSPGITAEREALEAARLRRTIDVTNMPGPERIALFDEERRTGLRKPSDAGKTVPEAWRPPDWKDTLAKIYKKDPAFKTAWQAETERLQKELEELTNAAKKAREEFEKKGQPAEGEAFVGPLQRAGLPTAGEVAQAVSAATQGTFSAAVANRLGMDGAARSKQEELLSDIARKQQLENDLHQEEIRILRRLLTGGGFS